MLRSAVLRLAVAIPMILLVACGRPAPTESAAAVAVVAAPAAVPHAPVNTGLSPNLGPDPAPASETREKIADASGLQAMSSAVTVRALPTRIELPSIHLDTPVEEIGWSVRPGENGSAYSQWDEAANAAGWHKNSAVPGEGGNVVLSGHNNILGAVFRELDQLKRGDIATLVVDGKEFNYAVDKILILPETSATPEQRKINAEWIQPTDSERLTLVSCWPRDNNTHRIVVVAYPVEK